jgi:hypothetical protein
VERRHLREEVPGAGSPRTSRHNGASARRQGTGEVTLLPSPSCASASIDASAPKKLGGALVADEVRIRDLSKHMVICSPSASARRRHTAIAAIRCAESEGVSIRGPAERECGRRRRAGQRASSASLTSRSRTMIRASFIRLGALTEARPTYSVVSEALLFSWVVGASIPACRVVRDA